ncbi:MULTISPECIES: LysR family transcriptional regulator [Shewanella]|jgi:DNA-binding transcriptional LysR family regulator|uniref:LysR family transcriptional regulator n=1 Tax=Shewanella TaxID=22 RepID=UPI000C56EA9D|nr:MULTISPECIES: LysR family transcriptional regulator [Shewanella]NCQ44860.1 LysR family transcriptional regulator [Shewanella frigidimarina]MBB1322300.1 LysR family transcriptional regulator [Shewanella sp. SR43-8]MBB1390494.1 LysR family transcriptional regulator [Shewanella sp. SG44-6]NCO71989.1 LysR family transcriptional regulator [Shewanella vesiculosa]NCP37289.1 LysR family transcriptional regulator [Shewanella vesiculosa]|tara:strand:+ start:94 stop:1077 length:984 start_codon:yes stop_codon:yes gene_type:complete
MNLDNLARVDLNLLVILQVLLEEQSVTRAAHRLHVSQSAVSKSLNRLRETLDDPLFQRTAHGLKPTAHADALRQQLPLVLQNLYQLTQPPTFYPATSNRQFSLSMVESAYETLIPYFIGPLLQQAPSIKLDSYVWTEKSMQDLQQGQIDFGLAGRDIYPQTDVNIEKVPEGIESQTLFNDHQVCLVRKDHPILQQVKAGQWDQAHYLSMSHVQVRCEGNDWWALDYHLANLGLHRHLSTTVPDFYGAASVCANTDLIFTLPSSFAHHAQKLYSLVSIPLPFEFMPMAYVFLWHERNNQEPGHQWFRNIIFNSVERAIANQHMSKNDY